MPNPTLVFNVHEQFEQLRQYEHYQRMRDTIRRRDVALQGDLNPMVADFGADSEARQYSGRAVAEVWKPPGDVDFTHNTQDADHVEPEPTVKGMSR